MDIEILGVCPEVEPEIGAGLSYLLMEGMRLQDERESGQAPPAAPPPAAGESRPARRRRPELDTLGPVAEALKRGRSIKGALGLVLLLGFEGLEVIVVLGAVVSIVHA